MRNPQEEPVEGGFGVLMLLLGLLLLLGAGKAKPEEVSP